MNIINKYPVAFVITVTTLITGCSNKAPQNAIEKEPGTETANIITLTEAQLKTLQLNTDTLQQKSIQRNIRLNGKVSVSPAHYISVTCPLGGHLQSIKVLAGSSFKKGQVLAVLQDQQFIQLQQDYLTTTVQVKNAELNYNRQKELNSHKASSDKTLQLAETEYKTFLVTQKALEQKLKIININPHTLNMNNISGQINIYAPFNGIVDKVTANQGKYVSPSDIIFELINPEGILLNLKVFEKDINAVRPGQELLVYSNDNPVEKLNATITATGSSIQEDGAANVQARLLLPAKKLVPGMYINADITTASFITTALPEKSIVSYENKNYIFEQLNNNSYKLLPVETGSSSNGFTEILNPGNLKNKKILVTGVYDLLMGLKNMAEEN